jgi:hypothetical protein
MYFPSIVHQTNLIYFCSKEAANEMCQILVFRHSSCNLFCTRLDNLMGDVARLAGTGSSIPLHISEWIVVGNKIFSHFLFSHS